MAAGLGWIDFSKEHRDRVFSVIDMLSEGGTVDELGIGVIRDALADYLFPGVTTIQTRPKYFILIPQLLQSYEKSYRDRLPLDPLASWLEEAEHQLMLELASNYSYAENNGVIGINVARNKGRLARTASSVYWNGIRVHGIVDTHYSLNDYLRRNNLAGMVRNTVNGQSDEEEGLAELAGFGLHLPRFEQEGPLTLDLSAEQARYLRDQFRDNRSGKKWPDNLLKCLLESPGLSRVARDAANFETLAAYLLDGARLPSATAKVLRLAVDFAFIIHGAHIRFNIQLHRQAGTGNFQSAWEDWLGTLEQKRPGLAGFDLSYLLGTVAPQTRGDTKTFITEWHRSVLTGPVNEAQLDALVRAQEVANKKGKAKLTSKSGAYTGWVGISELNYRFPRVQSIITDILKALEND